jgi:hypothetical protein
VTHEQRTLGTGVGLGTLAAGVPSDFLAVLIGDEDGGLTSSRGLFLMLLVLVLVLAAGRGGGRLCPWLKKHRDLIHPSPSGHFP